VARIPYPDLAKLPPELSELLRQVHLNIFSMWAHSVSTVGLIMNLGAAQFAKLELPWAKTEDERQALSLIVAPKRRVDPSLLLQILTQNSVA